MGIKEERHATLQGFKLVVLAAFLAVSSLVASEVKLKDGKVYPDAEILERDDQSILITVPYGKVKLPLDKVESIDGVAIPPSAKAPDSGTPGSKEPQPAPAANSHPGPWHFRMCIAGRWIFFCWLWD